MDCEGEMEGETEEAIDGETLGDSDTDGETLGDAEGL